jgi:hypothetical protein
VHERRRKQAGEQASGQRRKTCPQKQRRKIAAGEADIQENKNKKAKQAKKGKVLSTPID